MRVSRSNFTTKLGLLLCQGNSVGHDEQAHLDSIIVVNHRIKLTDRDSVRILRGRVDDPAEKKGIVDCDKTTGPDQCDGMFVILPVICLIGIDEHEVEAVWSVLCEDRHQSLYCITDMDV